MPRINPPKILIILLILVAAALLVPNAFPYPAADAPFSDFSISHYPTALYIQRALWTEGAIPLWSDQILSGYPLFANPLSSLYYPPHWLTWLLPLPWGLNVIAALHLLLGAWGMFGWLRDQNASQIAATISALAFGFMPKLWAHYGAGHLTLIYAVSLTPWLLRAANQHRTRGSAVWLALITLADPRWLPYAGVLWSIGWLFAHSHRDKRTQPPPAAHSQDNQLAQTPPAAHSNRDKLTQLQSNSHSHSHQPAHLLTSSPHHLITPSPPHPITSSPHPSSFILHLSAFLLLTAPLLIPLLQYTRLSTRAALTPADTLSLSLPPARLLGLLLPDWGGGHEWTVYPGAVVLALALAALLSGRGRTWGGVAGLALLWALGESIPGLALLARLPGVSLLRVPPRALFAVGIIWALLAGFGWDALRAGLAARPRRTFALALAAISAFAVLLGAAAWIFGGVPPVNLLWGAGVWGALTFWNAARSRWQNFPSAPAFVLLGLLILDGLAGAAGNVTFRDADITLNEQAQVAQFLAAQPGDFRVYSPSYSLPQQTAAFYGLKLADGVDPLQLSAYAAWMDAASGVPRAGYSVTLPPLGEDVAQGNAAYVPDAGLLGMMNVRFVAAEFDIKVNGLREVARLGETRIYENAFARGAAWLLPEGAPVAVQRAANRLTARTVGAGTLVFAEVAYPGWQAFVDGAPAPLRVVDGLLRAVDVPPGEHTVSLVFRPLLLWLGLGLAALGILLLVWRRNA